MAIFLRTTDGVARSAVSEGVRVETCFAETALLRSEVTIEANYFGGSYLHRCAWPERTYLKLAASQLYAAQVIDLKP